MPYGYIYRISNSINAKEYYGQTIQNPPTNRWKNHKKDARTSSLYGCAALDNAMRFYGIENFKFEVMLACETQEELNEKEIEMISMYNSISPNGYNLKHGGEGGGKHSEETKLKMKLSHTGKIFTESHKLNLSEASKNMSNETKTKIGEAMKGNINMLGKKHSEASKIKMREAHKNRINNKYSNDLEVVSSLKPSSKVKIVG